jgi:hypothetical protein
MGAALRGHINICKVILSNEQTKRLIDEKDPRGRNALDIVLAQCCSPQGPAIIDLLRTAKPGMSVSNEDLTKYVVREGAVRLLPGGRVIKEEVADENGEIEFFRIVRLVICNESARGARQMEVAEAYLREMPISAFTRVNTSSQTVLHVSCGALPVPKKKSEEKHEEFHRQGNVGTDRAVMEELKAMMKDSLDEDKGEETLQEGLVLSTIDNDRCRAENITVLALAENRARRRLHRRLVAAVLNAIPDELREHKDDRGMRALDYARVFGDEEIQRMLKSPVPVRPRSPSARDDLSMFHYPNLVPKSASSANLDMQEGSTPTTPTPGTSGRRLSSPGSKAQLARPGSAMSVNSFVSSAQGSEGQPREGDAREGWGETSTAPSTRPQTPVRYSRKGGESEKESKVP